ncbi:hypothetical protein CBS101457_004813 [Exobasidium rhododendri]|nr:hypothetical protein CBS101457_004813 [Exobasidium rhododendri]
MQNELSSTKDWLALPSKWQDLSSESLGSDETLTPSFLSSLAEQDPRFAEQKAAPGSSAASSSNQPQYSSNTPRSPSVNGGFFSLLRPMSPKVILQQNQQSTATSAREDAATSFYSPTPAFARKAIERDRDISANGADLLSRNRRSSSVFDQFGGMLDRFGRRLHSRGESKEERRVLSSSMLNGSAVDACVSDETVSGIL